MTLNSKLGLSFLVVALGVGTVGVAWVQRATIMKGQFDEFANLTTPALVALGQIKAASLEMAMASDRASGGEPPDGPVQEPAAASKQAMEQARAKSLEWLMVYHGVAARAGDQKLAGVVEQAASALTERATALAEGGTQAAGRSIGVRRSELHDAERIFARIIDSAIAAKVAKLKQERSAVGRSVNRAVRLSLAAVGLFVLLAVALGVFIAGTLARPIIKLSNDARIIGTGELAHRTTVRSNDEIGTLAQTFNQMTENLERTTVSKAALEKAYAELQRTQQQLVQSEKLAALGRFSAGVAHEVKNPLGIILGGVEFLGTRLPAADEDAKTALGLIEKSVHRADTIVRDLLKFARPSQLKTERVAPEELVNGTVALLTYGGALKQVSVSTRFAHGEAELEVDKNQIQQVLLNLMMNAVDAMPSGGSLTISTFSSVGDGRPGCRIEVADTGEGIASEQLGRLFEPFFTTKRDKKGTGLGLSISKTIVESHGGAMSVASEVGMGTTFAVILPARAKGGRG